MTKLIALLAALAATAAAPAFANDKLAQEKSCMACHAMDKKLIGPAFKDVAAKYAGEKGIADKLAEKIMKGGAGSFGPVAMPPNPQVSAEEAKTLANWVLSVK